MDALDLLTRLVDALDTRDWDALAPLTGPGFVARFVHTGETFDVEAYAAFQASYPGAWRVVAEDAVGAGERAVVRARVTDAAGSGETHHVAMFATARGSLLVELVEVWAEDAAGPPADRRG